VHVLVSVFAVQAIGTLLAAALVLVSGEQGTDTGPLGWAAAGGLGGVVGVTALYLALSRGTMGLIAPLSGVIAAAVPVVVSVATGDPIHPAASLGMLVALGAIVAVALPASDDSAPTALRLGPRDRWIEWGLAAIAGIGFAAYFLGVDRAHGEGAGTWWTLLAARGAAFLVVLAVVGVLAAVHRLPPLGPVAGAAAVLTFSAVGDLGGNLFYVLALERTTLAVAVVLSSLYPVVTTLLARTFLGERLTRTALAGVALATAGVVLIGIGSTAGSASPSAVDDRARPGPVADVGAGAVSLAARKPTDPGGSGGREADGLAGRRPRGHRTGARGDRWLVLAAPA
jgi:drug/metabolite transporter (DMT)-like permease